MASFDWDVLLYGNYAPATVVKYRAAVDRFWSWCLHMEVIPQSYSELDKLLAKYMVLLYYGGRGKADASCALYGLIMDHPGIRSHLPRSLRSLKGYERMVPSEPRVPMPYPVAIAMAIYLALRCKFDMAVGVLLSFDCYLRAGEMLQIRHEDVSFGLDPRLGLSSSSADRVHVHVQRAKTGNHQGVEVWCPHVKSLLAALVRQRSPGDRLFQFSYTTYTRWFRKATVALQLPTPYTPHCLRHGGATRDYLDGVPVADVQLRGRWRAAKSATHYIQMGRQLMMMQSVPQWVDELGRRCAPKISRVLVDVFTSAVDIVSPRAGKVRFANAQ